jgi:zinc protease
MAQQRTLHNGISVVVLEDHHSPVVSVVAVTYISSLLEPVGKTGLSGMVSSMLDEGTTNHNANQLADAFAELGNSVSPFGFYTISANVDRSLDLMAEQLLHPAFPDSALSRLKANMVTDMREEKSDPNYLAQRVFANAVYGETHPYARFASESETMSVTRDDIVQFYANYFCPPNVKFVIAGDITPSQAVEKLNRVFGMWRSGKSGQVSVPVPPGVASTAIYLYDRPNSPQSVIRIGNVGPRRDTPDYYAIRLMNTILGGAFNSRINLSLREQHQYTYGASSSFQFRRVPQVGTFSTGAAVETPKTDSALIETIKELRDIRSSRPITSEEFSFARAYATTGLPLQFETIEQRASAVAGLVSNNLPLDYYNNVIARFGAVTQTQAEAAATKYIDPSKLAIVVVGDRAMIESKLRAAGIAPVVLIDKPL